MMNKKEKPWDSFVLFAPEKMMEQDTEDYFFYGSDEYITLSKDNHVKNWNYCDVIYEVLAQHYGLETGWLDVTNDFKIALFFAVCYWCDGEWLLRIFHRGLLK